MIKILLLNFAFLISFFSLWYTHQLVQKLEAQERQKIETWAKATKLLASTSFEGDFNFLLELVQSNNSIPAILTNSKSEILTHINIDPELADDKHYLQKRIEHMQGETEPFEIDFIEGSSLTVYYENSELLNQLKIYPYFQLGLIGLFLAVSYFAFSYSRTSEQNKVWAGMSKETAHQLGTPISSLMAWIDYLKENEGKASPKILTEIDNDMKRLLLITERFSKIGSEPVLERDSLYEVLKESTDYIDSRTSDKVKITIENEEEVKSCFVKLNRPLFAWVIENLCKNAVDAMEGKGNISFRLHSHAGKMILDVVDTGKGISSNRFHAIFKPGFTTKKRGWGLGLSLVKRIIENYHRGKIFVKSSELGKGTTFRIELKTE